MKIKKKKSKDKKRNPIKYLYKLLNVILKKEWKPIEIDIHKYSLTTPKWRKKNCKINCEKKKSKKYFKMKIWKIVIWLSVNLKKRKKNTKQCSPFFVYQKSSQWNKGNKTK